MCTSYNKVFQMLNQKHTNQAASFGDAEQIIQILFMKISAFSNTFRPNSVGCFDSFVLGRESPI